MMNDKIKVRFARQEDAATIVEYNQAMARETEGKDLLREVLSAGVSSLLSTPTMGFYAVAEHQEKIAGCLMVTTEWSDWRNGTFWWIQSVYVPTEFRRQGIYRSLYQFVKSEAEKHENVCGFRLYVEKENITAQKTYESLGMVETDYKLYEELKQNITFLKKAV